MSEWAVKRLDEVADRVAVKNSAGHQRVLTVSAGRGLVDQETYFNKRVASADLSGYWVVEPGDFVYNKSTSKDAPWGVVARWDGDEPAVVTTLYIVFRARPGVESNYILHACNGTFFFDSLRGTLREGARAHGLLNVRLAEFFGAQLVVPSPAEQRRIVDVMTAVDEQIDAVNQEAEASSRSAIAIAEDALAEFERVRLDPYLDRIESGRSPMTNGDQPRAGERGVLKVSAVSPFRFIAEESKALSAETAMPKVAEVRAGDVLITRANTPERVGAVCRVPDSVGEGLYLSDKTLRLVPGETMDPDYLVIALALRSSRHHLTASASGTSASMFNISQAKIRSTPIPVPDVDLQRAVARVMMASLANMNVVREELAALRVFRTALLTALLNQEIEIPESYDSLLEEVS